MSMDGLEMWLQMGTEFRILANLFIYSISFYYFIKSSGKRSVFPFDEIIVNYSVHLFLHQVLLK